MLDATRDVSVLPSETIPPSESEGVRKPRRMKFYFGIEVDKIPIVEKSEQWLEFSDDLIAKAKTIKDLEARRDAISARPNFDRNNDNGEYTNAVWEVRKAKREIEDIVMSSGVVAGKFSLPKVIEYLAGL